MVAMGGRPFEGMWDLISLLVDEKTTRPGEDVLGVLDHSCYDGFFYNLLGTIIMFSRLMENLNYWTQLLLESRWRILSLVCCSVVQMPRHSDGTTSFPQLVLVHGRREIIDDSLL